jgi:hypothetical protein
LGYIDQTIVPPIFPPDRAEHGAAMASDLLNSYMACECATPTTLRAIPYDDGECAYAARACPFDAPLQSLDARCRATPRIETSRAI